MAVGGRYVGGRERLCRYLARPALARARLEETPAGLLRVTFKRPWADGTAGVTFAPLEFVERLAAECVGGRASWVLSATSAMLLGPGVRSGVYGATDDGLRAVKVDVNTGAPSEGGRLLQAQDVLATVAKIMGLDASQLYPQAEVIHAAVD